jgi:hypothetical protein
MMLYFTGATLTFGILVNTFMKDTTTPKTDLCSWAVLSIGAVLWPLVLFSMFQKHLHKTSELGSNHLC